MPNNQPIYLGFVNLGKKRKGNIWQMVASMEPSIFAKAPFDIIIGVRQA